MSDFWKNIFGGAILIGLTLLGNHIYADYLSSKPNLQWATVDDFSLPFDSGVPREFAYGFTLLLRNDGGAPAESIEIFLDDTPSTLEARPPLPITSEDREGSFLLTLDALGAEDSVEVDIYGLNPSGVNLVRVGGEQIPVTFISQEFPEDKSWWPTIFLCVGLLSVFLNFHLIEALVKFPKEAREQQEENGKAIEKRQQS